MQWTRHSAQAALSQHRPGFQREALLPNRTRWHMQSSMGRRTARYLHCRGRRIAGRMRSRWRRCCCCRSRRLLLQEWLRLLDASLCFCAGGRIHTAIVVAVVEIGANSIVHILTLEEQSFREGTVNCRDKNTGKSGSPGK